MKPLNKTTNTVYLVGGLMGEHCIDSIEYTLSQLDGINHVSVNQTSKQVSVKYNSDVIESGYIEEILQTLGYSVRE